MPSALRTYLEALCRSDLGIYEVSRSHFECHEQRGVGWKDILAIVPGADQTAECCQQLEKDRGGSHLGGKKFETVKNVGGPLCVFRSGCREAIDMLLNHPTENSW